jgi:hypothetical protein
MIKITNRQIDNLMFQRPKAFQDNSILPPKVRYWLGRVEVELERLYRAYSKERKKTLQKYAKKDEKTGKPIVREVQTRDDMIQKYDIEDQEKVNEEIEVLMDQEIEISDINPIKIDLEPDDKFFSPNDMAVLMPFCEFVLKESSPTSKNKINGINDLNEPNGGIKK